LGAHRGYNTEGARHPRDRECTETTKYFYTGHFSAQQETCFSSTHGKRDTRGTHGTNTRKRHDMGITRDTRDTRGGHAGHTQGTRHGNDKALGCRGQGTRRGDEHRRGRRGHEVAHQPGAGRQRCSEQRGGRAGSRRAVATPWMMAHDYTRDFSAWQVPGRRRRVMTSGGCQGVCPQRGAAQGKQCRTRWHTKCAGGHTGHAAVALHASGGKCKTRATAAGVGHQRHPGRCTGKSGSWRLRSTARWMRRKQRARRHKQRGGVRHRATHDYSRRTTDWRAPRKGGNEQGIGQANEARAEE